MSSQNREKSTFCPLTESNLLLKVTLLFRRSSLFSVFNLGRIFNFELLTSSFLCCIFDTKQIPKGKAWKLWCWICISLLSDSALDWYCQDVMTVSFQKRQIENSDWLLFGDNIVPRKLVHLRHCYAGWLGLESFHHYPKKYTTNN